MNIQGIVIVSVITYLLGNVAGYVIHRLLHNRLMGKAFRDHCHHHFSIYPASDYLSDVYREAPLGAGQGKYYVPVFLLLCTPFLFWGWPYFLLSFVEVLAVLKINAVVHDSLHIKGHSMERFRFFIWLREVHFQHHVDVHTNYGIFSFMADKIFGTYTGILSRKS
jgi:sterol desaturase/sphingolipid hydroxylase (fatty acid hydroxylase superfamily)